jgi:hypothetical protein
MYSFSTSDVLSYAYSECRDEDVGKILNYRNRLLGWRGHPERETGWLVEQMPSQAARPGAGSDGEWDWVCGVRDRVGFGQRLDLASKSAPIEGDMSFGPHMGVSEGHSRDRSGRGNFLQSQDRRGSIFGAWVALRKPHSSGLFGEKHDRDSAF